MTVFASWREFRGTVGQKQHLAVRLRRQAMAKASTRNLGLFTDRFFLHAAVHAEWWVREDIINGLVLLLIVNQCIAALDGIRTPTLNQQVSLPEGKRRRHEFLAEQGDLHIGVHVF